MRGEDDEIKCVSAAIIEDDLVVGGYLAHRISANDLIFKWSDDFFDVLA